jgi:hypothetical protein
MLIVHAAPGKRYPTEKNRGDANSEKDTSLPGHDTASKWDQDADSNSNIRVPFVLRVHRKVKWGAVHATRRAD